MSFLDTPPTGPPPNFRKFDLPPAMGSPPWRLAGERMQGISREKLGRSWGCAETGKGPVQNGQKETKATDWKAVLEEAVNLQRTCHEPCAVTPVFGVPSWQKFTHGPFTANWKYRTCNATPTVHPGRPPGGQHEALTTSPRSRALQGCVAPASLMPFVVQWAWITTNPRIVSACACVDELVASL